jgi:CheY-like chemotaxis protein
MYVPQPINPRAIATFLTPIAPEWVPVLVADDHEESRIITRMMLECAGHRVFEASSGTEALEIAFAERPRAAILDIVMPGLDGWSTARRLRKDPRTSSMILMAVTALAGDSDRVRSIAAGFDTVLVKPVRPLRMLEVLRSFMPPTDPSIGMQRTRPTAAAIGTELRTRV